MPLATPLLLCEVVFLGKTGVLRSVTRLLLCPLTQVLFTVIPRELAPSLRFLGQFCPWCDHHAQQAKQVPSGKANKSSLAIHTRVTAELIVLASGPTGKPTCWSVTSWALPRGVWHQHDQIMFSKGKIMSGCVAEDTDESQYCPGGLTS